MSSYFERFCRAEDPSCRPLYLFANEQQELTARLRNRLVDMLSALSWSSPGDPARPRAPQEPGERCNFWNLLLLSLTMRREDARDFELYAHCFPTADGFSVGLDGELRARGEVFRRLFYEQVRQLGKFQFFAGSPLSGAPMHSHAPAVNVLLQGRKLWHLLPPGGSSRSLTLTLTLTLLRSPQAETHTRPCTRWTGWLQVPPPPTPLPPSPPYPLSFSFSLPDVPNRAEVYPFFDSSFPPPALQQKEQTSARRSLCRLYQEADEVLFVPRHWSHQVLNLENTIGFAVEIDNYIY